MEEEQSILIKLLNQTFQPTIKQIEDNYLNEQLKEVEKWLCYSDYCLDDINKPNSVVTFSILPVIDDLKTVESFIKNNAKKDIKKTRQVNKEFIEFLKKYPLINFSFVLENRKNFYGSNHNEIKKRLKGDYLAIKKMYENWISNEPEKATVYKKTLSSITECIKLIDQDKKIKQLIDILLIPLLGGYVSNIILNRIKNLEIYGWFSDRDKLLDIEKGIATNIFHNTLHGLIDNKNFNFGTAIADCNFDIFYDEFIKLPDYIAGTLADYNLQKNTISKKKFDTVLTDYMGDNKYNNYVFRISVKENNIHCEKIEILKKASTQQRV